MYMTTKAGEERAVKTRRGTPKDAPWSAHLATIAPKVGPQWLTSTTPAPWLFHMENPRFA